MSGFDPGNIGLKHDGVRNHGVKAASAKERRSKPGASAPRQRTTVDTRKRLIFVAGALALGMASLVVRAVDLQLIDNEFYRQQGNARFLREVPIAATRGMIADRNGEPLAVSSPVATLWADPSELLKHRERLPELAKALGADEKELTERLDARGASQFFYLRRHMMPEQAQDVIALDIPGVYQQREFRRFYPLGESGAHVLGFTNIDDAGQEGLELAYNDWLTGKPGSKRVIRDRKGNSVEDVDLLRDAEPGRDLHLALDRRLQAMASRDLAQAIVSNKAQAGSVVVLDVTNGEVLAMVNQPSYNPNNRSGSTPAQRRNRAVIDLFEPGSTFKPFTTAAALETGKVTPDTMIDTWPGTLPVAGHTIRDVRNFGTVSVTRMLTKSSNVAAVKLAMGMSSEHMHDVFRRFGFGQMANIGFPGESSGVLPDSARWGVLPKATISFGYGVSVSALQLAQAYAAIGNGGRLVQPTFLKGGQTQSRAVIDPAIAADLVKMLETVVGPEGTAQRAALSGYRVAGKSGTSRKAGVGGYDKRYVSVFAGLVPASNPRFAVVVMVDDPTSKDAAGNLVYYGGAVAGPVFHNLMEGALRILDVPPDNVQQWVAARSAKPLPPRAMALPDEAEEVPELFGAPAP